MSEQRTVLVGDRRIGPEAPVFVIAEVSANHGGSLDRALELIDAAAAAGVDAVKFQTYTADTMTLDAPGAPYVVGEGTIWEGRRLYDLYEEAHTPWEWHGALFDRVRAHGLVPLSTPFDGRAVDLLVGLRSSCLKIASFELTDHALVKRCAASGLPLLMSTGMATAQEIDAAIAAARGAGATQLALFRCNSAYPAAPAEMDLRTIPDMVERWGVPVGLSDHTLTHTAAVAAVALGATLLEKHVTMARADGGPDAAFSLEPTELAELVSVVREAEAARGQVRYGPSKSEEASLAFRRSIHVVQDVGAGEEITAAHVAVLRPAGELLPTEFDAVLGRRAARLLTRGTPLGRDDLVPPLR